MCRSAECSVTQTILFTNMSANPTIYERMYTGARPGFFIGAETEEPKIEA